MNQKMTVLVVDDERVVRDGCLRVLKGKGYEALTAENGQLAMDTLSTEKVDIILLDLKMPVMGGEEVLDKTHGLYPDIPVIIITGHGTIDTAVQCMKKGAYDFITKPFQIDQFLLTVKRAAEKRRLELQAHEYEEEKLRNLYDLNLEKSRLKTIINCIPNGVMVTNRGLEVVLHNSALLRLLEISQPVENPVPITQIINNEPLITSIKQIHSDEWSKDELIAQEIVADKTVLRAISAPAIGPDGSIVGVVTVLEDITAFKQLDKTKSEFVHMVAHELRSPLSAVRQQNSIILEGLAGPLKDKQEELLGRGVKKIDQLLELINDLLDIAKLEQGVPVQHRIPIDIGMVIKDMVALMEPKAKEQGISLAYSCDNLKPVQADPKGVEEIFNNLISNAINYSPDGGKVTVAARGHGEYVEIKVADTGLGIPSEELSKIFDRFYRIKHPKTRQVIGTGLGLAIVKGVVEAHHGTIDVDSTVGKGTTFKILLPVVPQPSQQ